MIVRSHVPHFEVVATGSGWAIDAISSEDITHRLVGVYTSRAHALAQAARLKRILHSRDDAAPSLTRVIASQHGLT